MKTKLVAERKKNRPTDTPSYRDAWTHLNKEDIRKKMVSLWGKFPLFWEIWRWLPKLLAKSGNQSPFSLRFTSQSFRFTTFPFWAKSTVKISHLIWTQVNCGNQQSNFGSKPLWPSSLRFGLKSTQISSNQPSNFDSNQLWQTRFRHQSTVEITL